MVLVVSYSRRGAKDVAGLQPSLRDRALRRLNAYAEAPEALHHDVVHLVGTEDYRLRVGDWRVVFRISGERLEVLRVRHRREVYR